MFGMEDYASRGECCIPPVLFRLWMKQHCEARCDRNEMYITEEMYAVGLKGMAVGSPANSS
jgi:hypothetical protein